MLAADATSDPWMTRQTSERSDLSSVTTCCCKGQREVIEDLLRLRGVVFVAHEIAAGVQGNGPGRRYQPSP